MAKGSWYADKIRNIKKRERAMEVMESAEIKLVGVVAPMQPFLAKPLIEIKDLKGVAGINGYFAVAAFGIGDDGSIHALVIGQGKLVWIMDGCYEFGFAAQAPSPLLTLPSRVGRS